MAMAEGWFQVSTNVGSRLQESDERMNEALNWGNSHCYAVSHPVPHSFTA